MYYSLDGAANNALHRFSGSTVTVGFRPEEVRLAPEGGGRLPTARGTVELVEPLGSETNVVARFDEQVIVCKVPARSGLSVGDTIRVEFEPTQMKLFDPNTGASLDLGPAHRRACLVAYRSLTSK